MKKHLQRNKLLIILIILVLCLAPSTINKSAESDNILIITAIGLDKLEDNYKMSLQYIVPTPDSQFNQELKIISTVADSIASGINNLTLQTGKHLGFLHCKFIVINQDVASDNLTNTFDYFLKEKVNTYNISLVCTPDSAQEFLEVMAQNSSGELSSFSTNTYANDVEIIGYYISLDQFYSQYLTPQSNSVLAVFRLIDDPSFQYSSASSGGGSSSGAEQSAPVAKKIVTNFGEAIIFKNGRKHLFLTKEDMLKCTWFNPMAKRGIVAVNNVSDEYYKNNKILFEVNDTSLDWQAEFDENGTPVYKLDFKVYARIVQIDKEDISGNDLKSQGYIVTKNLIDKFALKVKSEAEDVVKLSKENKIDLTKCYEKFNKYANKDFKKYLSTLTESQYFLEDIIFDINVKTIIRV